MSRILPKALLLVCLLAVCTAAPAAAQPARDGDQPVHLSADNAELNNTTGVSVYTGNVVLTQGSMTIRGDKMTVHTDAQHQLQKAVVIGQPATYEQLPEGKTEKVHAQAPRMEYYAGGPERVVLLDGAKLWQGKNTFTGEHIVYQVAADKVNAQSGDNQRIHITLYPKKEDEKKENGKK